MIKDTVAANEQVLPNDKEMAVLKEHFPGCFHSDGSFDLERFKEFLSDKIAVTGEGYELKFLGKNYARLLASLDTTTVIVPDDEHNSKPENKDSQNIYISGDNLDGLKQLLKSYANQVKCIYIDPPYNTGSDGFVYNDSFNFNAGELSEKLSISEEQAQRILDLTKRGSASHSAWLMFMYSRLLLARDLLSDDGIIFISIDENEMDNLSLLCNDVFGEENQIAQLVWQKRHGGGNDSFFIAVDHEYVLTYVRNKDKQKLKWRIPYEEEYLKRYSEIDEDGNRYYWDTLSRDGLQNPIILKLTAPDGSIIRINSQKSQTTVDEEISKGWVKIEPGKKGWSVRHRVYQPEGKVMRSILLDVGTNTDSSNEIENYFGFDAFDYSKPMTLIKQLVQLGNMRENDIVVDFFSGSGTTADMVMRHFSDINARFIMIQLPENLDTQYETTSTQEKKDKIKRKIDFLDSVGRPHTLDQIGIERIIRAAKEIKEENPDTKADLGFKHYTLQEPTTETIDKLISFNPEDHGMFVDNNILSVFGLPTVLTTWLIRDGYGFSAPVQQLDFAGYKGYYIDKHLYLIETGLSKDGIAAIVDRFETDGIFNPENIVLFGYSFPWTTMEELKMNLGRLKDTEKNLRVNFDVRY